MNPEQQRNRKKMHRTDLVAGFVLVENVGPATRGAVTVQGKYELASPSIYADRMVKSLRLAMPDIAIWQYSDLETPPIPGVSGVNRCPYQTESLMAFRLGALANLAQMADDRPWVQLDTDTLVLKDLSPILENDFEIAMLHRDRMIDPKGSNIAIDMPFNTGVIFGRGSRIPEHAYEVLFKAKSKEFNAWWGDQRALKMAIDNLGAEVFDIGRDYNFTPNHVIEVSDTARVLHYKGPIRKQWMLWHADHLLARSLYNGLVPKAVYEKYQEEVSRDGRDGCCGNEDCGCSD